MEALEHSVKNIWRTKMAKDKKKKGRICGDPVVSID